MNEEHFKSLKIALDQHYQWPADYVFKFLVPAPKESEVQDMLEGGELSRRASSSGKYVSITSTQRVQSSDEVIAVYRQAATIEGLVAL